MIVEKVAGDLKNYLEKNIDSENFINIFISFLIQICYTLLVFQSKFEGFYHGDLHCGNILYSIIDQSHKIYKYEKIIIKVETFSMCPKIWDFETSILTNVNNLLIENNNDIIQKYFNYIGDNKPTTYTHNAYCVEKDIYGLINSFLLIYINRQKKLGDLISDNEKEIIKQLELYPKEFRSLSYIFYRILNMTESHCVNIGTDMHEDHEDYDICDEDQKSLITELKSKNIDFYLD
jgi:hypothetical protein